MKKNKQIISFLFFIMLNFKILVDDNYLKLVFSLMI